MILWKKRRNNIYFSILLVLILHVNSGQHLVSGTSSTGVKPTGHWWFTLGQVLLSQPKIRAKKSLCQTTLLVVVYNSSKVTLHYDYIKNFIPQSHFKFFVFNRTNYKTTTESQANTTKNNDAVLRQVSIVQQVSNGSVTLTTINPGSLQVTWLLFEHCFGLQMMDTDASSQTQSWQPYWNFSPNCHLKSETTLWYYLVLWYYLTMQSYVSYILNVDVLTRLPIYPDAITHI